MAPLAERLRPQVLEDVFGQQHLIGKGKVLSAMIEKGQISNMIFYGPSGTGKTTVARIAASQAGMEMFSLNATTASVADIKAIAAGLKGFDSEKRVLLFLDEIQNFSKKQQQSLLEHMESGRITLIASTTENPYFYVYNALLSRSLVFEFFPLSMEDVQKAVMRAAHVLESEYGKKIQMQPQVAEHLAYAAGGDVRKALNALESCVMTGAGHHGIKITLEAAEAVSMRRAMRYDRDGDSHYDILSAFQKSIRGSDADASIHYLARLVSAGDMASICRRLLVIAAEDISLAYPSAISIVKSCVDAAFQLGFPEARIPLAQAVLVLACAPKSNSAITAIDSAMADIEQGRAGEIPSHLKDSHYSGAKKQGKGIGYRYPHSFPQSYVPQQYLPDNLVGRKYYLPGNNKHENAAREYWEAIKDEKNKAKAQPKEGKDTK